MKNTPLHTPEPWTVKDDDLVGPKGNTIAECIGYSVKAKDLSQKAQGGREANAIRIADCVNACAEISDPTKTIPKMLIALQTAKEEFERRDGAGTCPSEIEDLLEEILGQNPQ
jgi:hypothetical protein